MVDGKNYTQFNNKFPHGLKPFILFLNADTFALCNSEKSRQA
jgi:hypothetical protein